MASRRSRGHWSETESGNDSGKAGELSTSGCPSVNHYIAINCLACKENLDYYTLNYNSSPYEIDAEQAAIMSTYLFLRKEFPDSQYEQLILNYVNDRCAEGNYKIKPIKDGYKSIKDVNIAFNQAFEKSKFDERFFDIQSSDEISMFLKDNEN